MKILKNKIIQGLLYLICFIVLLIFFVNIFTKYKQFNIIDALNSLQKINTANINLIISKKEEDEQINFIYKTNYNKSFNGKESATDGNLGFEVESMQLGIYVPIQTITNNGNLDIYFKIDEVYKDLFHLGQPETIHINLNSFFNNFNLDYSYQKINEIKKVYLTTIKQFSKSHKKDFTFLRNNQQTIMSGTIGQLNISLNKGNIQEFNELFKKNLNNETLFKLYQLDKIENLLISLVENEYLNFSLDIYSNYVSSINIFNDNFNVKIDINNINNKNTINIIKDEKQIEFIDYFKENGETILDLFGYSESNNISTNLGYFKDKFNVIMSYMSQCIEYSEQGNYDYANTMLNNIDELLSEMKQKELNEEDISLSIEDYNNYIKLFEELRTYSYLYKDSCESPEFKKEEELQKCIINMDKLLKELGVSLNSNFQEGE